MDKIKEILQLTHQKTTNAWNAIINHPYGIPVIVFGIAMIFAFGILGNYVSKIMKRENVTVSVKGQKKAKVISDMGTYVIKIKVSGNSSDRKKLYVKLEERSSKFKELLIKKGSLKDDIVRSAAVTEIITSEDKTSTGKLIKQEQVSLIKEFTVISHNVLFIENMVNSRGEIVEAGFEIDSDPSVTYDYTKLPELRRELLRDATNDAKERVQAIASNTGQSVKRLTSIDSGSVEIYAEGKENADCSWNCVDSSTINKTIVISVSADFELD